MDLGNIINYLDYTITGSKNIDLETKVNRCNHMCSAGRSTLENKRREETQIKFIKLWRAPTLTYGSEIWAIYKKKDKIKIKPAEMKFLWNETCYRRKDY
jgi:hypothetical protein